MVRPNNPVSTEKGRNSTLPLLSIMAPPRILLRAPARAHSPVRGHSSTLPGVSTPMTRPTLEHSQRMELDSKRKIIRVTVMMTSVAATMSWPGCPHPRPRPRHHHIHPLLPPGPCRPRAKSGPMPWWLLRGQELWRHLRILFFWHWCDAVLKIVLALSHTRLVLEIVPFPR